MPYAVLLPRTNSTIRTRTLSHIHKTLADAGVAVLKTELNEREAFRAMFSFQRPRGGRQHRQGDCKCRGFVSEVIDLLRRGQAASATAAPAKALEGAAQ